MSVWRLLGGYSVMSAVGPCEDLCIRAIIFSRLYVAQFRIRRSTMPRRTELYLGVHKTRFTLLVE